MCGSAMPPVKSAAIRPLDAPASKNALLQRDRVEQVATLAADRLGEGDAEQTLLGRSPVQLTGDLLLVSSHAWRWGATSRRTNSAHGRLFPQCPPRSAHRSESSIAIIRERTHSPRPLACGSNRVDAATPLTQEGPDEDAVDATQVRQDVDLDVEVLGLGDESSRPAAG